jgi:methylated-DNA-protein-cysteine methyltransferase related protein
MLGECAKIAFMDIPAQLSEQVIALVKTIPRGRVMSYGQIATKLGIQDARQIGWIMHSAGGAEGVPWWRVLNNEGKITIKDEAGRTRQKELLAAEGIEVNENFMIDIEKYRFGTVPGQKKLF